MVEGDIRVKVIPDTTVLDKELKKKRTFTGLLGFGGGEKEKDNEASKDSDKTNSLLGKILGSLGFVAIISSLLGGLFKLLRPFVELFSALSFLVWFPLWKALKPVLSGLGQLVKNVAKEGGGFTGLIEGGKKTVEKSLKGESIFKRIGIVLLAVVVAAGLIFLTGVALIPALIIAGLTTIITLIILAWDPLVALFCIIVQAWKDFFKDIGIAWDVTVGFFKKLGKRIGEFGSDLWQFFVDGFKLVLDFGQMIWDVIKSGLSFLSNLGQMIWDVIKSSLGNIGGGIKSTVSSLNPFNDFIQRPEQAPTAFSPNDTIIGVKNPTLLSGGSGGNTFHNTFQLGPINNDMDVRVIAQRIAEINKDELAMSTGSQRF